MASFLTHVIRLIDPFHYLPLTSVPSAAVSDEDTEQWSAERYELDLANEPQPRTGEAAS